MPVGERRPADAVVRRQQQQQQASSGSGDTGSGGSGKSKADGGDAPREKKARGASGLGLNPAVQLRRLMHTGIKYTLIKEHAYVLNVQPTVDDFFKPANQPKNRKLNTLLYDATRVILDDEHKEKLGDYIHASYVDGYERCSQYILCQAPFTDATETDFWRMTWLEQPSCIVVLSGGSERHFWPRPGVVERGANAAGTRLYADKSIMVSVASYLGGPESDYYELAVAGKREGKDETTTVKLLHYKQWREDKEVPTTLLQYLSKVRLVAEQQETAAATERKERADTTVMPNPPLVLVCETGVHRSGTYAALDILTRRMLERRRVALGETVAELRRERYGCVELERHYGYLHETLANHAIASNYVNVDALPPAKLYNVTGTGTYT